MRRSDLEVGQELYHHSLPDWQHKPKDGERVIVKAIEPYRMYGSYGHRNPMLTKKGPGVLVDFPDRRSVFYDVGQVVQLSHLKGEWKQVHAEQAERNKDLIQARITAKERDAQRYEQQQKVIADAHLKGIEAKAWAGVMKSKDFERQYGVMVSVEDFAMMLMMLPDPEREVVTVETMLTDLPTALDRLQRDEDG